MHVRDHKTIIVFRISVETRDTIGNRLEKSKDAAIQSAPIISCFVNSASMSNFQYNGCRKKLA